MKSNIENNNFDLTPFKQAINNQIKIQTDEINKLKEILKMNKNVIINNEIKKESFTKFALTKFRFEDMINIKTLNNNQGAINCIKTLDDGRIAAGDSNSNLIIYNKETFNPEIIIKNNLGNLFNLIQLKNKNIVCSFKNNCTLKIMKIKNNDYEDIQIILNAHYNYISKIIELTNENLITLSWDCSFKI